MRHPGLDRPSCNQQEIRGMKADAIHSLKYIIMFKVWRVSVRPCLTLQPRGLQPTRLLCPWDFPGKNAGVGCYFLTHGIFWIQGLNRFACISGTGRWVPYRLCQLRSWDWGQTSRDRTGVTDSCWCQLLLARVRRLQTEQGEMERGVSISPWEDG